MTGRVVAPRGGWYPIASLAADLAAARELRGRWLVAVSQGMLGVGELLGEAEGSAPLRRITLAQLFAALPGWDRGRAVRAMVVLRRCAKVPADNPNRDLTVGWVLDDRSRGPGRVVALANALLMSSGGPPPPPHDRFPFPAAAG